MQDETPQSNSDQPTPKGPTPGSVGDHASCSNSGEPTDARRAFLRHGAIAAAGLAAAAVGASAIAQDTGLVRPISPGDVARDIMVARSDIQLKTAKIDSIRGSYQDIAKGAILQKGLEIARTFGGAAAGVSFELSFDLSW